MKTTMRHFLTLASFLVLAGCGSSSSNGGGGGTTTTTAADAPPTGTLAVSGTITADSAAKGNTTKDQTVTLKNLSGDVVATGKTDSAGKYSITAQPGALTTSTTKTTLADDTDKAAAVAGSLFVISAAVKDTDAGKVFGFNRTVKLSTSNVTSKDGDTSTIDVGSTAMSEIGAIYGTLTFSDSTVSVAGTDVFVPGKSLFVRTGSDGTFNFLFVPPGTYSVRIENGKYFKTQDLTVVAGKTTNAGTVNVGLTDRNPKPLSEVIIGKWTTETYDEGSSGATTVTTTTGSAEVKSDNSITFTGTSSEFLNAGGITSTHLYAINDSTMYFRIITGPVLSVRLLQVLSYTNNQIVFKSNNKVVTMTRL